MKKKKILDGDIKRFIVEHNDIFWTFEIEMDIERSKKQIEDCVKFWAGWEKDLQHNNNDFIRCFLKILGATIFRIVIEDGHFPQDRLLKEEGFGINLDGSVGIKILSIDPFDIDRGDFYVTEQI